MSDSDNISALNIIKENYKSFGEYVNKTRGNVGLDGLKSVQRRVLLSVRDCDKKEEIGSSEIVAHCLNNYHPHSDSSIYDTLVRLVQKGFVVPKSNFGNNDTFDPSESAAYRYTSVAAHKPFTDGVFRFIDLVESEENEYGRVEPKTLPVPIPLALTTGSTGIGFGVNSSIPFFSAKSLFAALHADDPSLLKAPNGLFIVSGDVKKLWETGDGFLQYGYKVYQQHSDLDGKIVSIIEGPGRYFQTGIRNYFSTLEDEGTIYIRDESSNRTRVAISRVKNIKRITDEQVHALAQQASVSQLFFRIFITEDGVTKKIPIRVWMQKLWNQYENIVEQYKTHRIDVIKNKLELINLIPKVEPLLRKELTAQSIASKLHIDVRMVSEIESKPLRVLRKSSFDKETESFRNEIVTVSKLSARSLAQDIVNVLERAQST